MGNSIILSPAHFKAMMLKLSTAFALWFGAQAFELDCQKSACPEMCMCSSEACSDSIGTCLDDGDCASVQDCAMTCGCGDDACLLQCAAKTTSPFAVPVAECIKSKCPVPSLLKASVSDAECGAAACKEACECSNEQCHDEVHKCLDDPECAKVQACAMDCNCGDDNCLMSCVEKSNSPVVRTRASVRRGNALVLASRACWTPSARLSRLAHSSVLAETLIAPLLVPSRLHLQRPCPSQAA